jgi:hypothetical protein
MEEYMKKVTQLLVIGFVSCFLSNAWAGPCEQIKQACSQAGFIKGEAKVNKGLIRDCVNPIMQGKAVAGAPGLPAIDPTVIAACRAKHPKFGEGKVGM